MISRYLSLSYLVLKLLVSLGWVYLVKVKYDPNVVQGRDLTFTDWLTADCHQFDEQILPKKSGEYSEEYFCQGIIWI